MIGSLPGFHGCCLALLLQFQPAGTANPIEAHRQKKVHDFIGNEQSAQHRQGHWQENFTADTGSNKATLTRAMNSVVASGFSSVIGEETQGTSDTASQQSIDFALQLVGNWTNG